MQKVILYRDGNDYPGEFDAAKRHFRCVNLRTQVWPATLTIGRYSVLPFYKELEEDLIRLESRLINTWHQHMYVADMGNWLVDLEELTPRTWNHLDQLPETGPFVVKGQTNSKKFQWDKMMFAKTRKEAVEIACDLQLDGLLCDQHIYVREYVPLVTYMTGLSGLPITKEFRFFICDRQVLCGGYYWSNFVDELPERPDPSEVPEEFLKKVIRRVGNKIRFYVVDVAQTQSGDWIVIELNDGQMSGLSENDPEVLYSRLAEVLG